MSKELIILPLYRSGGLGVLLFEYEHAATDFFKKTR